MRVSLIQSGQPLGLLLSCLAIPVISNTGGSKYIPACVPALAPAFPPDSAPSRHRRALRAAKRPERHAEPLPVRPDRVKAGEATPRSGAWP